MKCLKLKTANFDILGPSEKHLLVLEDGSYVFAKDAVGKKVAKLGEMIESIEEETADGIFAPLTECGTYLVFPTATTKMLAHCFCNVSNPDLYFQVVKASIKLYNRFFHEPKSGVHPVAAWLKESFNFLVE